MNELTPRRIWHLSSHEGKHKVYPKLATLSTGTDLHLDPYKFILLRNTLHFNIHFIFLPSKPLSSKFSLNLMICDRNFIAYLSVLPQVADKLTISVCRLSINLGATTPWRNQGLSRPVSVALLLLLEVTILWDVVSRCLAEISQPVRPYVTIYPWIFMSSGIWHRIDR